METTSTTKGQIVIPSRLRKKYGIKEGTRIRIVDDGERIILQPITREYIHRLRGSLRGNGGMKALIEDRRREREV